MDDDNTNSLITSTPGGITTPGDGVLSSPPFSTRGTNIDSDGLSGYIGISFGKSRSDGMNSESAIYTPYDGASSTYNNINSGYTNNVMGSMNNKIYNNYGQPNQPDNNASLQKPKKTVVLHQVWGEGTTNNSNGKNKNNAQRHVGTSPSLFLHLPRKNSNNTFSTSLPSSNINKQPSRLLATAQVISPSVEDLDARLNRMKERVSRSLANNGRRSPGKRNMRPNTTQTLHTDKNMIPTSPKNKRNLRPLHLVKTDVENTKINSYGDLELPNQPELRKWMESYTYEQAQYKSFALHAEMHLKRLVLLGPLPNRLALAVSLDILGQLPNVVGRYSDIVNKIHDVLYQSCYVPIEMSLEDMSSTKESKKPSTLIEYFNRKCFFLEYEKTKRHSEQVLEAVKKLGVDARSTLQFMAPIEIHKIIKDVLLGLDLFNDEVRYKALDGLGPKDAAKMVLNAFECSKKIHTANQTIGLLLSIIKKTNPEQKAAIYESLFEDVAGDGMIRWLIEEADETLQEDVYRSLTEGFVNNNKNIDNRSGGGRGSQSMNTLLRNGQNALRRNNGGNSGMGNIVNGAMISVGNGDVASSVESFLSTATEEDVEILRKIIMHADEEHGVRWKLILPWEEDEDGVILDNQGDKFDTSKIDAAKRVHQEIDTEKKARSVIGMLRTKVHQGKHRKRRKKKLKITMAKFKLAARTVMLASEKATDEKAKKKVISVDISANSAEAFDADIQVNSADIDAAMHAFEDKSESFIKFCHREKKKLLNIFENLTADELANNKRSTIADWNKICQEHNLKIPDTVEKDILKTLGAPDGRGNIDINQWVSYLDSMISVNTGHEGDIMSKMGMGENGSLLENDQSWMVHLLDMVELAEEKSKKKKRLMIRVNKKSYPPSFNFSISSTRFNAQDFTRAASKNLNHTLQEIAGIYPEYYHTEINQSNKTRESFSSFVYSHYLANFGLPKIADVNLMGLVAATLAQQSTNKRVETFGQFFLTKKLDFYIEEYCQTIIHLDQLDKKDRWSPNKKRQTSASRKTSFSTSSSNKKAHISHSKKKKGHLPLSEKWVVGLSTMLKICSETMHRMPLSLWDSFVIQVEELADESRNQQKEIGSESPPRKKSLSPKKVGKDRGNSVSSSIGEDESPRKKVDNSPRKGSHHHHRRISAIMNDPKTRHIAVDVDKCMEIMLETLQEDRLLKVKHLASLFSAADVDGNGELSFSEFSTLIYSLDPIMDDSAIVKIYREALLLNEDPDCEMTTQSFVAAVEAHGLMHLAVENSSALGSVMGDMNALKKTWQESKPFIIGTFEALLRDLDEDSDLLVYKESGDKSLQGIKDRVLALEKLILENSAPKKAWQSYWIVMREFWNAATEGPGIQTLYPLELSMDKRSDDIALRLGDHNTMETEPSERVRRKSLVHLLMPDTRRITVTMPSMIGNSKSNI